MKKLSKKEEKKLQRTDSVEYKKYYDYMRAIYEKSKIANLSLEQRKLLYPLLRNILRIMNRFNFNTIKLIGDKRVKNNRPKIYAVTHIGKCDIEMISEVIGEHTYILSGDFENLHSTTSGLFLETNGIIYLNEYDKADRKQARITMEKILKNGGNILYFPEGTWNLTPSSPIIDIYPGIIDIAINANAEIVPVAIEQYRREKLGSKFIANIGKNFEPQTMIKNGCSKAEVKERLKELMATLKWEIFESVDHAKREDFAEDYYEKYIQAKMQEWPGFTLDEVREKAFINKNRIESTDVFKPIDELILTKENSFLLRKTR